MYETVTARLDESYTVFATGTRVTRIRDHALTVVPAAECDHTTGHTMCAGCAAEWQNDYEFDDPFPFRRIRHRWTIADLIDRGLLRVGEKLNMPGSDVTAIVTHPGGLMLPNGKVYGNSSAAANAALAD